MTNHGDDCYFFYYSNCSKGDSCPFRHCEAAMGSETTCNLWEEGRCFRAVCKFRHMEITKNRKVIHCYWENQPAGCQKPHCAFFHAKPRCIDGMFVPADKSPSKNEEQQQEEESPPPAAPLPAAANPQLRGVIKTEAQEPVPSPTHPPVVINPADDDEDEDDQFSEEGEDGKVGPSPRKLAKTGECLNFGVSTLEEIRLRKALKASMKRAGYPIQSADTSDTLGKENIQSFFRPSLYEERDESLVFGESVRPRGSVAERLGRRMPSYDGEGVLMKRSLADRLGSVVDDEEPSMPPQKVLKPIRERLGRSAGSVAPTLPAETNRESRKAPERIRIKTLEEIRQEKAAKCQSGGDGPSVQAPQTNTTKSISPKATKAVKQAVTTTKDNYKTAVKTFSEVLHAKKKGQQQERAKAGVEKASAKSQTECAPAEAGSDGGVRVKTLEEIRRDKAARMQAQQTADNNNNKTSDTEETSAKKPRLLRTSKLRTSKLPAQTGTTTTGEKKEKSPDVTEKPVKSPMAVPQNGAANGNSVKVKTFEEIMREKRNRRQEMEEEAKSSAEAEPGQTQSTEGSLKRKSPARVTFTMAASPRVVPTDTSLPTLKPSVGKRLHITSKASTPVISPTAPALTSLPETCSQSLGSSTTISPAEHQNTLNNNHKEYTADTKVRPKLNVKPSVMKPAVQVKPGQKRRGAQRSAVAAVKPLLSTSTGPEEPLQDTPCTDTQVFPSSCAEAQLSSAVPQSPSPLLDSSPLREELQTVPVFTHSQESKPTVPQSSVLKTATQAKSRRLSVGAPRTVSTSSTALSSSAVDDFDDLMNEFTEDHLEGDMDPGIGEDDLLQELSEMIDS